VKNCGVNRVSTKEITEALDRELAEKCYLLHRDQLKMGRSVSFDEERKDVF
jgi:hypothetical protein